MNKSASILVTGTLFFATTALAFQPSRDIRRPPQFAQEINQVVSGAKSKVRSIRQTLRSTDQLMRSEYEQEYQKAMAMVCQGHCSPGITASLQHMHDVINRVLAGVDLSEQNLTDVESDLVEVTQKVNQAQRDVNGR